MKIDAELTAIIDQLSKAMETIETMEPEDSIEWRKMCKIQRILHETRVDLRQIKYWGN